MINAVFDACVILLVNLASLFGTTYKAINVWIFCVIGPIVFMAVTGFAWLQWRQNKRHRSNIAENNAIIQFPKTTTLQNR